MAGKNCFEDQISKSVQNSALFPQGSVSKYWDSSTSFWSLNFRSLLKEEKISNFQLLLESLDRISLSNLDDKKAGHWNLIGFFQ